MKWQEAYPLGRCVHCGGRLAEADVALWRRCLDCRYSIGPCDVPCKRPLTNSPRWSKIVRMPTRKSALTRSEKAHAALAPILKQLGREEATSRLVEAGDLIETLRDVMAEVAALRRSAVRELRAQGWTLKSIAEETGLTIARIGQIEIGEGRAERISKGYAR